MGKPETLLIAGITSGLVVGTAISVYSSEKYSEFTRNRTARILDRTGLSESDLEETQRAFMLIQKNQKQLQEKAGHDFRFSISLDGKLIISGPYNEELPITSFSVEELENKSQ